MQIKDIYQQYQIMPSLQLHQKRVTAVAQVICQSFKQPIDQKNIVTACLLHDMGNIIKFDLQKFPEFVAEEGLPYWQEVQNQYFEKYGQNEHQATLMIAEELKVNPTVIDLIDAISFDKTQQNYEAKAFERMICEYADDRVAPMGIVSLEDRITDLDERYKKRYPSPEDLERRQIFAEFARKIEIALFEQTNLHPTDLSEETLHDTIHRLEDFEIDGEANLR